jgi:cytosine/adenosine deaminase-related metal-dependent hydrolase
MSSVYFARYLLMPDGTILQNGGIAVEGGTISSVGSRGSLKRTSKDRIVNLGSLLLMPGCINMHTHLEESALRGYEKCDSETFAAWMAKKNSRLKSIQTDEITSAIRLTIREALANGITTIVDSSRTDISAAVLRDEPIRSWIIFEEHPEAMVAEECIQTGLQERIARSGRYEAVGVGPHALFSMAPATHKAVSAFAQHNHYLWATHLSESAEELQAFTTQSGDLHFQITRKKNWPFGKTERGPMYYAVTNSLIPNNAICFHCNYVDGQELSLLSAKNVTIVHCPQYTREIGHKPFPLDIAFRRGINICLGTESPSLDRPINLFDELFLLKQAYPHIPAAEMIRWITLNPARSLGQLKKLGSIETGKMADIIGLKIPPASSGDILEEMLQENVEIAFVMVNGEELIIE